jgi:hypothetical protein
VKGAIALIDNAIQKRTKVKMEDLDLMKKFKKCVAGKKPEEKIMCPCLFVASKGDSFVSSSHTEKLFEIYPGEKKLLYVKGDHNAIRSKEFLDDTGKFLEVCFSQKEEIERSYSEVKQTSREFSLGAKNKLLTSITLSKTNSCYEPIVKQSKIDLDKYKSSTPSKTPTKQAYPQFNGELNNVISASAISLLKNGFGKPGREHQIEKNFYSEKSNKCLSRPETCSSNKEDSSSSKNFSGRLNFDRYDDIPLHPINRFSPTRASNRDMASVNPDDSRNKYLNHNHHKIREFDDFLKCNNDIHLLGRNQDLLSKSTHTSSSDRLFGSDGERWSLNSCEYLQSGAPNFNLITQAISSAWGDQFENIRSEDTTRVNDSCAIEEEREQEDTLTKNKNINSVKNTGYPSGRVNWNVYDEDQSLSSRDYEGLRENTRLQKVGLSGFNGNLDWDTYLRSKEDPRVKYSGAADPSTFKLKVTHSDSEDEIESDPNSKVRTPLKSARVNTALANRHDDEVNFKDSNRKDEFSGRKSKISNHYSASS